LHRLSANSRWEETNVTPILYVLVFLATVLAAESIFFAIRGDDAARAAAARKRLDRLAKSLQAPGSEHDGESLLRDGVKRGVGDRLLDLIPQRTSVELLAYRAGGTTTPARLLLTSIGLTLGGFILGAFVMSNVVAGLLMSFAGAAPWIIIRRTAQKRMAAFEQQLPDALALMTRAMRAGHSLGFGLRMVGEEMPDPIGVEFLRVADEVQLGQDLTTALKNLDHRVDVSDLPFFITAIGIQRETGGNLTEILDKLSHVIRERFKLYGKVRAITAMGRASANLLAFWPLVMVGALYSVNPDYVAPLWEQQTGHMMVMISAGLVAVGYVICRRMAEIEV
jgi:tight adherence protein B